VTLQTFDAVEKATLHLTGHVPSKKDLYRRKKNGGLYLDKEVKAQIASLETQARIQWGPRKPLVHPDVSVTFYVRSRRPDKNNKHGCLMDVLQAAGVIKNDNIKWFNGREIIEPAVVARGEESTIVDLKWSANA